MRQPTPFERACTRALELSRITKGMLTLVRALEGADDSGRVSGPEASKPRPELTVVTAQAPANTMTELERAQDSFESGALSVPT